MLTKTRLSGRWRMRTHGLIDQVWWEFMGIASEHGDQMVWLTGQRMALFHGPLTRGGGHRLTGPGSRFKSSCLSGMSLLVRSSALSWEGWDSSGPADVSWPFQTVATRRMYAVSVKGGAFGTSIWRDWASGWYVGWFLGAGGGACGGKSAAGTSYSLTPGGGAPIKPTAGPLEDNSIRTQVCLLFLFYLFFYGSWL